MRQLVYTSLLLIILLCFTCDERKNCSTIKKSQNIMNRVVCNVFCFLFMSSLTALIVKNSHILAGICFIFQKAFPRSNLKGFQYQIWISVERSAKLLSSKTKFSPFFLEISCSIFRLKLCQRS